MSQENVEIVRAAYEAWNAGDMNAWGESFDPEIEAYDHDIQRGSTRVGGTIGGRLIRSELQSWRGSRRSSSTLVSGSIAGSFTQKAEPGWSGSVHGRCERQVVRLQAAGEASRRRKWSWRWLELHRTVPITGGW